MLLKVLVILAPSGNIALFSTSVVFELLETFSPRE